MTTVITVIHIVTCFLLVLMVLIQSGKGAEISASFGGSSQTVFGSSGGANFFVKVTGVLAAIFFCTSLTLTVMGGQAKKSLFESSLFPGSVQTGAPTAPVAAPAPGTTSGAAPGAATAPAPVTTAPPVNTAAAAAPAPAQTAAAPAAQQQAPAQQAPAQH